MKLRIGIFLSIFAVPGFIFGLGYALDQVHLLSSEYRHAIGYTSIIILAVILWWWIGDFLKSFGE